MGGIGCLYVPTIMQVHAGPPMLPARVARHMAGAVRSPRCGRTDVCTRRLRRPV